MNVYGYEVPNHVIEGAMAFMRRDVFTTTMLTGAIDRLLPAGATPTARYATRSDIPFRAADRLVQRERKAGRLIPDGKMRGTQFWRWVDGGAA